MPLAVITHVILPVTPGSASLGMLWSDTTANELFQCTSISPVTWLWIGPGEPGAGGGPSIADASSTVTNNTVVFSNSNGVSFGLNGSTMTATVATNYQSPGAYLTTADLSQNSSKYAGINGAITGGSITVNTSGVSVNLPAYLTTAALSQDSSKYAGINGAITGGSITVNTSGVSVNLPAYLTTAMASNRGTDFVQATAAFAGTNASGTINSTGISVSVASPGAAAENNWVTLAGNVVGNSSASGSTLQWSAGPNITLSGTNNSVIGISGLSPATLSFFAHGWGEPFNASSSFTVGGSSVYVEPFVIPQYVSVSYIRMQMSNGFGSTTAATTANTTVGLSQQNTYFVCLYSQGAGASSRSIQSFASTNVTFAMSVKVSEGTGSNQTCSHWLTYPVTGNSSVGFTTGYNITTSSVQVSTTHLTAFTGARWLDVPFATLITPGNYWLAWQCSSATTTTGPSGMTNLTWRGSNYAVTQVSANINEMGGNTTAGSNMWLGFGHGWWTTNSNGATTASINLAQVSTIANQPVMPFQFVRQA